MRIMASCPIAPRASSPTTAPSRSTTTLSAHCSTSFRRCEMKITATPLALSSAITFRRRAVSEAVRLDVGSSMMTMRASSDSALMISTSWRWASERSATGVSASKSQPSRRSSGATFALIAVRSISFNGPPKTGSRPIITLAATSRLSKRLSSWCTKAMPAAMAPATVSEPCATPSMRITPSLGSTTPPRIFIRVDLPAPFSPISARTSPRSTRRPTRSSAFTPG